VRVGKRVLDLGDLPEVPSSLGVPSEAASTKESLEVRFVHYFELFF
jgi:hypothetical protein